jgi:hypothetical protein
MVIEEMTTRLNNMSILELMSIWSNLDDYDPEDMYDSSKGISMDDWAQAVYLEIHKRQGGKCL